MPLFSFIDHGTKDFVRDHDGDSLKLSFNNYDEVESFIMDGGLDEYGWTNEGTEKYSWDDDDED